MQVFRLTTAKYAHQFNGKGAANSNNRWNTKGTEVIYTAENRALALAEILVHLPMRHLPKDYRLLTIEIPNDIAIKAIQPTELEVAWNQFPHTNQSQQIGNEFIQNNKYCLLKVPSAVVQGDFNVLINPHHKDFHRINVVDITPFPIDNRLFR